jgi:hypothetical protein
MSLADYKGPPNTPDIFHHLIGDVIKAAFLDKEGRMWLIMTCGHAVVLSGTSGGPPAYWHEGPDGVQRIVGEKTTELKAKLAEIKRSTPGIDV